ncbi:MAG: potassium transporter Kup [Myxococcales bacterium]|nr:MAG: potassium transporter Kup [Myxococcales bacterium]
MSVPESTSSLKLPTAAQKASPSAPGHAAPPSSPSSSTAAPSPGHGDGSARYRLKLALAALGVVYGDIGTSPLYAMRECFNEEHGIAMTPHNVMGVLSLIFWALTLIVSLKYVAYVLRADNKGEGGILALMALASAPVKGRPVYPVLIALGVFGAALLYGDGVITPAISVLSAVEGLEIAAPGLSHLVTPLTIVILIGLFAIQKHGTAGLGKIFGPITLLWFGSLFGFGAYRMVEHPGVLASVNPLYAAHFLTENGVKGLLVLGSVVLVVTGGEALYADLGHFGRKPIRLAWYAVVMPALLMNYFGQGALLIKHPEAVENPFFRMVPSFALYPMVVLSTAATVIASQALISGVYSLTSQGTMLGLLPRVSIKHTSAHERGQIYVPFVNYALMLATIGLVLGFKSSSNLAAAYGIAVTLTMVITTVLAYFLVRNVWGWGMPKAAAVSLLFLAPEVVFMGANAIKIEHGGWFPLVVGAAIFAMMFSWKRGREILAQRFREQLLPLTDFFDLMRVDIPARVPGTAVFMVSSRDGTPPAMLHNFMHNRVVHQHIVLLTVVTSTSARVAEEDRFTLEQLEHGFVRVVGRYGFMEQPDAPRLLLDARVISSVEHVTFFLGRENLIATQHPGMARWRVSLFAFLTRNAQPATKFFNIPPDRVFEIGAQIEL